MRTFFEKQSGKDFRNFIDYPIQRTFKPLSHNCCGFAANGDPAATDPAPAADNTVKTAVRNLSLWNYGKTALALIGLYVAVKFVWGKLK